MQQIISFLLRNKHSLLFIFLLAISLFLTIQSHSYHRSKFIHAANALSGGIYASGNSMKEYFRLKTDNQQLVEENARLREYITNTLDLPPSTIQDSAFLAKIRREAKTSSSAIDSLQFEFIPAKVINNNYVKTNNYITLKAGTSDEVQEEMGVITSKGIVGIVHHTSSKYSTVLSILNSNFRTNVKLKNSDHAGILSWDGEHPNQVLLSDIQQQADVKVGDTIETSGKSAYFPKGIPIGFVTEATLDNSKNFYNIRIKLFNDMTSLGHVYVIKNNDIDTIRSLENLEDE